MIGELDLGLCLCSLHLYSSLPLFSLTSFMFASQPTTCMMHRKDGDGQVGLSVCLCRVCATTPLSLPFSVSLSFSPPLGVYASLSVSVHHSLSLSLSYNLFVCVCVCCIVSPACWSLAAVFADRLL